jgi:hypothetical protein
MKNLIKAQDIIEKLKQTDPQTYAEIKENTEKVKQKFEHGGKRAGAGRKILSLTISKNRSVRLTDEEYAKFLAQGGANWLREKLKEVC